MKYNIGDKVRIRKDLIVDKYYGEIDFIESMKKYLGKETIICAIDYKYGKEFGYLLKDCNLYTWTDEMLEPIVEYDEEKSSLEKALKLLNMTEEEVNKEYGKTNCNIMFVLNYLKDKEMLILPTKEDDR